MITSEQQNNQQIVAEADSINIPSRLCFESAGLFVSKGEWCHPTRTLGSHEIIFVVSGRVYIRQGKCEYALEKDNALILTPNIEHSGFRHSTNVSFYWLHFTTEQTIPQKSFVLKDTARLTALFRMLLNCSNTLLYPKEACAHFVHLVLNEISFLQRKETQRNNPAYLAAEYITANISRRLTVGEVCDFMGYNPDYLCRLFKKTMGMSLKSYIDEQTIKKAKMLLMEYGKSVGRVADRLSFENQSLFSKFFKYHEGITPSQYAKMCSNTKINHK